MPYYKSDFIYPVSQAPIKNGVVYTNERGEVLHVFTEEQSRSIEESQIQYFKGIITPGFVNAHCHLELSHLHQQMPEHTGLIGFIKQLQKIRNQSIEEIESAAAEWQQKMYDAGIVAVGDVCNGTNALKAKQKGILHYHNFIELFSFNPDKANESLAHGLALLEQFKQVKLKERKFTTSLNPHAPYSTSLKLIKLIADLSSNKKLPIFIHNQECTAELDLYLNSDGAFIEMLQGFGLNTSHWKKELLGSMITIANLLQQHTKMIWVHNTFSTANEILKVVELIPDSFFCLCPNANLFIEKTLPNFGLFNKYKDRVCLGTDSLASNFQLSILSEMQTIQNNSEIDFDTLLQWATLNGAKALAFNEHLGSIEKGKNPGLVLINFEAEFGMIDNKTRLKRII
jgi:cytosine/adenosine deaminase-related metal-dependent hydrolase